jgi:hypothetical protein
MGRRLARRLLWVAHCGGCFGRVGGGNGHRLRGGKLVVINYCCLCGSPARGSRSGVLN